MDIKYKIGWKRTGRLSLANIAMIIDKNLLSWEGSIGISVLYVNEKETGKNTRYALSFQISNFS